jgi:hypothetical protein
MVHAEDICQVFHNEWIIFAAGADEMLVDGWLLKWIGCYLV